MTCEQRFPFWFTSCVYFLFPTCTRLHFFRVGLLC